MGTGCGAHVNATPDGKNNKDLLALLHKNKCCNLRKYKSDNKAFAANYY